ncbi:hypothetical protein CS0771_68690 [Catellatospora sp. IY07-71]|uniref:ABC transporter substrate-binding protein n=1 Tax=Catellatospora sp. IY07-71 TaxID=2728827 RepID=UPI001BB3A1BA|nr:ABC transporter substrate-binding protein [Catellatospora sp. IY07-71]BCJ77325.1 hypothetical protein CS0771_68690 [Catellatospora sp. IY07-71]
MTPLRLACSVAVVALLATGCTVPEPPPGPVVVGMLAPLSGPSADAGADAVRGAELAAAVINDTYPELPVPLGPGTGLPGLRGATLTLVTADTGGRPEPAIGAITSMADSRRPVGLVSAESAAVTGALSSQAQRLRVPLIDAGSTADYLTELGADWYFRTGPSDSQLAESAFALLGRAPDTREDAVTLVTESGDDGAVATRQLRELAERSGATVSGHMEVPSDKPDPEALATSLAGGPARVVFAWARTVPAATAVAAAVARGETGVTLFGLGEGFRALKQPGAQDPGLLRAVPWSAEFAGRNPVAQQIAELYRQRFGRPMTGAAVDAFTAVLTLAAAIDVAASDDTSAIRTALRQTTQPAAGLIVPWNGVRFGPDGQNVLAAAVVEQWQDRSYRLVYPVELATGPARWHRRDLAP